MARQKGIIKIHGNIGGMSFYQSSGGDFVRETTGITKDAIMNNPAFQRTRENMAEFGGSAICGKALRTGLASVIRTMKGRFITGRITKLMKLVNVNGNGVRGQRDFDFVANSALLTGFEFSTVTPFGAIFNAPYTYGSTAARNEATLVIPDFNTVNYLTAPQGSTHFRFVNTITVLSNYLFDVTSGKYEATDPALNELNDTQYSAYIALGGMVGATTTLQSVLPSSPVMTYSASLIGCIGIEFYQQVNTQYYLLGSGNAMRMEGVF